MVHLIHCYEHPCISLQKNHSSFFRANILLLAYLSFSLNEEGRSYGVVANRNFIDIKSIIMLSLRNGIFGINRVLVADSRKSLVH